jgi:UDP-2,3-diacylglucosamine pyrophosphatase LpxH
VYVISDLHLGGAYPDPTAPRLERQRGFRMMTHAADLAAFIRALAARPNDPEVELVINGDFIDFLAEELGSGQGIDPDRPPEWTAFRAGRGEALATFREVVRRDQIVFTALRELLAAGKALTIVIGNHDIELSLPDVRRALEAELGPGRLRFLDDGQAYDLGEAVIDHGNLYDPANVVDHDRLRLLRSVYSRGAYDDAVDLFTPPAGSKLVADVMNPIKVAYGFIDLLKPESEPLFALLLALEPSYRGQLDKLASALMGAAKTLIPTRGVRYALRNVNAEAAPGEAGVLRDVGGGAAPGPSPMDELVADLLVEDPAATAALAQAGLDAAELTEVAGGVWRARWSLFRLLIGDDDGDVESRLGPVQSTLRVLQHDRSFARDWESDRYLDVATMLAKPAAGMKGYKAVVFGHTHHAKDIALDSGGRYFNTGTWANLMKFPPLFVDTKASKADVKAALVELATKLKDNDLAAYLSFDPTYVRLDLGPGGELIDAGLQTWDGKPL